MSMLQSENNGDISHGTISQWTGSNGGRESKKVEPIDVFSILRRHPRIILLCTLISTGLGVLYFLKTPSVYESYADILIEPKQAPAFTAESQLERQAANQKHIATHTYSLTSPVIVERALSKLPRLASLAESKNPIASVIDSLSVEVIVDESNVVSLSCRNSSREDCYEIVSAVVKSYEEFLGDTSDDVGKETASLIEQARNELEVQLDDHARKYREFQQNAPLIWEDGKGVNTHYQRQLQVEEARSKLAIERAELVSKIDGLVNTLSRPNGRTVVFFEAMQELNELERNENYGGAPDQVVDREAARLLSEQLMSLVDEEARLTEDFAAGHPEVQAVRRRIRRVREQLSSTSSNLAGVSIADSPEKVDEYVSVYVAMLNDKLERVDRQMAELVAIVDNEQELASAMQAFVSEDELLQQGMKRTQELFDAVVARLEEINIIRDHGGDRMRVMATPQLGEKVSPTILSALALSTLLSMISGFGLAYLSDITESTFRSPDEIRQALQRPIVGMIPEWRDKGLTVRAGFESLAPSLVSAHRGGSNVAEAFRAVRTSLFFSTRGENHQVIQVTSPLPSDGKSTIASNLAITLAQAGKKVLLVDADFRRPSLHTLFGRPKFSAYGLAEVVRGEADPVEEDLATRMDNLFVMTCGRRPDNPSELLTSREFQATIEMLREQYDFIVFDTPPLLAVTDPAAIAARVDGVLLAMRIRRGSRATAERACEILRDVDANLLGIIVNAVDRKSAFGGGTYGRKYSYGYGYRYASEEYREEPESGQRQLELRS